MKLDFPHNHAPSARDAARGRYAALVANAANRQIGSAAFAGTGVPASAPANRDSLSGRIMFFCGLSQRENGFVSGAFLAGFPDRNIAAANNEVAVNLNASAICKDSFLDSDQPENPGDLRGMENRGCND
jgi:hypothetical protein